MDILSVVLPPIRFSLRISYFDFFLNSLRALASFRAYPPLTGVISIALAAATKWQPMNHAMQRARTAGLGEIRGATWTGQSNACSN